MSRAMRRQQQLINKPPAKGPSFRPSGPRPAKRQESAADKAEAAKKRSLGDKLTPRPVQEIVSELKKVTWPTREETTRLTMAVIVVAVIIGLALGAVDLAFNWFVDQTLF